MKSTRSRFGRFGLLFALFVRIVQPAGQALGAPRRIEGPRSDPLRLQLRGGGAFGNDQIEFQGQPEAFQKIGHEEAFQLLRERWFRNGN